MKLNKRTKRSYIGLAGCFGVLGLIAVAMLCPIQNTSVNAADDDPTTRTVRSTVTAYVQSAVSVALRSNVDIEMVPTATGAFSSVTSDLVISTNNLSGYGVYIGMGSDSQNLKSSNSDDTTSVIAPVAGTPTKSQFMKNTWGYNLTRGSVEATDATKYSAVPVTLAEVDSTDTTTSNDKYSLTFAAAVDNTLPAGSYSNTVIVSVVANPLEMQTLSDLTYMQDMTAPLCAASTENETRQLVDVRDGNKYWVAKLKDGNCWMTQNLDLRINATTGLSMATTDITANWGTTSKYPPTTTSESVPAAVQTPIQTTTYSWDFGKWVLATPTLAETAANGNSCGDVTTIEACKANGFVLIDDSWTDDFSVQEGWWNSGTLQSNSFDNGGTKTMIAADTQNKRYDSHYLIGNYYQFNTATAGTGGDVVNNNAAGSICPKNWKLPYSGNNTSIAALNNDGKSGSFYYLLNFYGLTSAVKNNNYNIATSPLYYVRSGYVTIYLGRLRNAGYDGYGWSPSAVALDSSTSATAYYLSFNASGVYPSYGPYGRWFGFPLRCLAR